MVGRRSSSRPAVVVPLLLAVMLRGAEGVFEVSSSSVSGPVKTDVLASVGNIFGGTGSVTFGDSGFESVAGSLALLAAALKAPLVALYQISAEVVVMVALILFISYIASLLGIDDFRRRTGVPAEEADSTERGYFARFMDSDAVQHLTERVHDAIENFDMKNFLQSLDTRY